MEEHWLFAQARHSFVGSMVYLKEVYLTNDAKDVYKNMTDKIWMKSHHHVALFIWNILNSEGVLKSKDGSFWIPDIGDCQPEALTNATHRSATFAGSGWSFHCGAVWCESGDLWILEWLFSKLVGSQKDPERLTLNTFSSPTWQGLGWLAGEHED